LPTSLIYVILSTRGFKPWRTAAVMSTTWFENQPLPRIFKERPLRTGRSGNRNALPTVRPYLRTIRFQGRRGGVAVNKKRELFPGQRPSSPSSVTSPSDIRIPDSGILSPIPFRRCGTTEKKRIIKERNPKEEYPEGRPSRRTTPRSPRFTRLIHDLGSINS